MSKLFETVDNFFDSQFNSKEVFEKCSKCGDYDYMLEGENICNSCKRKIQEADISIDTDLESTHSDATKAENYLVNVLASINKDYNLDNIELWITDKGNIWVRGTDGKDIVTLDRSNFTDSDIDDLKSNGYFDTYMSETNDGLDESEELVEDEIPASQLDFKHQQLAKVQSDIELIAGLKAEDTSNDLYTNLLDAYDKIVEVLTDAIAEDPVGTVVGDNNSDTGLTVDTDDSIDIDTDEEMPTDEISDEELEEI